MDLNSEIRRLCDQRGYKFSALELTPWECGDGDENPHIPYSAAGESWVRARMLRRKLKRELGVKDCFLFLDK